MPVLRIALSCRNSAIWRAVSHVNRQPLLGFARATVRISALGSLYALARDNASNRNCDPNRC
jgi:hypothetical protein